MAKGGVGEPGKEGGRDVQGRFEDVAHNFAVSIERGLAWVMGAWICLVERTQETGDTGSKTTPSRGRGMYEAKFEHHLGDTVVKTTLVVTTRRRWERRAHSQGWSTCRIGRLVFALNARLASPAMTGAAGHLHLDRAIPSRN